MDEGVVSWVQCVIDDERGAGRTEKPYHFPDYHLASALTNRNIPPINQSRRRSGETPVGNHLQNLRQVLGLYKQEDPIQALFLLLTELRNGLSIIQPEISQVSDAVLDNIAKYSVYCTGSEKPLAMIDIIRKNLNTLSSNPSTPYSIGVKNTATLLQRLVLWRNHMIQFPKLAFPMSLLSKFGVKEHFDPTVGHYLVVEVCGGCLRNKSLTDQLTHSCKRTETQLIVSRDGVVIRVSGKQVVFDINLLLMASDLMTSRDLMFSLSSCQDPVLRDHILKPDFLTRLYLTLDNMLTKLGNKGYSIIKYLEPLCLSQIILTHEKEEPGSSDLRFPRRTWSEIETLATTLGCQVHDELKELLADQNPVQLLEVFGLFRHWGHPIIDVETGLSKLKEHTRSIKVVNRQLMGRLSSEMSKLLLHNYFNRCLGWPPETECPAGVSKILEDCITENRWPTRKEMTMIPPYWNLIKHPKLIDDIGNIPIFQLLSDRAHSVNLTELELLCQPGKVNASTTFTRRVLLSAIKTEQINPLKFLEEVDKNGLPKDDLVIGLKAKEREVKPEGRFFSLMTFRLRLYFVTTEWLLTTYILPLFREITMTYSQVNLFELFASLTKGVTKSRLATFMIHLDYEKWNNHQRHHSTYSVFKSIDHAFGYENVISRTHQIFQNCFYYYVDAPLKITPGQDNHPYCWQGQEGGIEGLRQKGWSIVGALLLRHIAVETGLNYSILLQGDNQVIVLKFERELLPGDPHYHEENKRLLDKACSLLDRLCVTSREIGLITKREETWISSRLLMYGKFPVLDGAGEGVLSKRVSRLYATSNDVTPTLTGMMSTVSTLGLTMAQLSNSPVLAISLTYWYQCVLVNQHMRYSPVHGRPLYRVSFQPTLFLRGSRAAKWNPRQDATHAKLLFDLITRDTVVGGIGGLSPIRFYVRQFVDPLTETLTGIRWFCRLNPSSQFYPVVLNQGYPIFNPHVSYKKLLEDPTSLNLDTGPRVSAVIRTTVEEYLQDHAFALIQNKELKEAVQISARRNEQLINFLFSWDVILPKVAADIYSASLSGQVEAVLGHFTGTRTIVALPWGEDREGLSSKIRRADKILTTKFIAMHVSRDERNIWDCSYQHAVSLREASWRKHPIRGVTVPHPFEQFVSVCASVGRCHLDDSEPPVDDYILVLLDEGLHSGQRTINQAGPMKPYIGSLTSEKKLTVTACEASSDEPLLRRVMSILNEVNWFTQEDGALGHSLLELFRSLTDYPLTYESLHAAQIFWDADHRYRSDRVSHGSFIPLCFTPYTHVSCNSNLIKTFGRGKGNMKVVFQSLYIAFSTSIVLTHQYGASSSKAYHVHPDCSSCWVETEFCFAEAQTVFTDWPTVPIQSRSQSSFYCLSNEMTVFTTPMACLRIDEMVNISVDDLLLSKYLHAGIYIASQIPFFSQPAAYKERLIEISFMNNIVVSKLVDFIVLGLYILCCVNSLLKFGERPRRFLNHLKKKTLAMWQASPLSDEIGRCLNTIPVIDQLGRGGHIWSASNPIRNYELSASLHNWVSQRLQTVAITNFVSSWLSFSTLVFPVDLRSASYVGLIVCGIDMIKESESLESKWSQLRKWLIDRPIRIPWSTIGVFEINLPTSSITLIGCNCLWREMARIQETQHISSHLISAEVMAPNIKRAIVVEELSETVGVVCQKKSPLVSMMRDLGTATSAYWKLASLLHCLENPRDLMVLGDGNGGFTRYLLSVYRESKIVYNSLYDPEGVSEQSLGSQVPPALSGVPLSERARVVNSTLHAQCPSDIRLWDTFEHLVRICLDSGSTITHILSDAELYSNDDWGLVAHNLIKASYLLPSLHQILLKCHLDPANLTRINAIGQTLSIFGETKCLRSPYSNYGSYEVYLLTTRSDIKSQFVIPSPHHWCFMSDPERQFNCLREWFRQRRAITTYSWASYLSCYNRVARSVCFPDIPPYDKTNPNTIMTRLFMLYYWLFRGLFEKRQRVIYGVGVPAIDSTSRIMRKELLGLMIGIDIGLSVAHDSFEKYCELLDLYNGDSLKLTISSEPWSVTATSGGSDDILPRSCQRSAHIILRLLGLSIRLLGLTSTHRWVQRCGRLNTDHPELVQKVHYTTWGQWIMTYQ